MRRQQPQQTFKQMKPIMKPLATAGLMAAVTVLMIAPKASGQFIVDAAGPRNVFYTDPSKGSNTLFKGFNFNPQITSTPSLDLDYFSGPIAALSPKSMHGVFIWGLDTKVTAADGITQFFQFNQIPQLNISAIANLSWQAKSSLLSLTTRFMEEYGDYSIFDPTRAAGTQSYSRVWLGEAMIETFSIAPDPTSSTWIKDLGLAFSVGYIPTNNYASLPKETLGTLLTGSGKNTIVSSGKSVRFGSFNTYNALPITFLPSYNMGEANWLKGFPYIIPGWSLLSRADTYEIIVSPYGSYTLSDEGKPSNAIGLNFVLESLGAIPVEKSAGWPTGREVPAHRATKYPLSIFIERPNAFSGKPNLTVGAALTYHFP
jgi:hypothetical protein